MLKFKQKNCGVYFSRTRDTINCEPCQSEKITRSPFHVSSSHATAQTGHENAGELREQLNAADHRIEELKKELVKVHQQMLDHLSDSQMKTSEIRGEVEQIRWQLLQESGVQKTELLRARQDMVNRIIQIGEKSLERKPERRYPLRERNAKVFRRCGF
jgi:small-conductance mechanosensitive channel